VVDLTSIWGSICPEIHFYFLSKLGCELALTAIPPFEKCLGSLKHGHWQYIVVLHNPHSPGDLVVCNEADTNMLSWPRWRKFSFGNNLLDYTVETHKVVPFDRTRNNQWRLWFGTSWAPCVQYVIYVNEIILTSQSKMAWKLSDYLSSRLEGFVSIHGLTISDSPLTTEVQFCSIWKDTTWPHTIWRGRSCDHYTDGTNDLCEGQGRTDMKAC